MKKIIKGPEPRAWTEYCATPGVDYQATPELRESLIAEQGYICAYCLRRITLEGDVRVEHIKPRSVYPDLKLKYSNMVLCCSGLINSDSHCDVKKGNQEITFDLFSDDFFATLSYSSLGEIKSSNIQWNREINAILNLNNRLLKLNRQRTLEGAVQCITNVNLRQLRKFRKQWAERDKSGQYKPYCSIVLWYMDKRLKQTSRI